MRIQRELEQARPLLIGISGGSGSGKTTLADALRDVLGAREAQRVEHDAYYHDLSHLEPVARAVTNFDHPRALDNAMLGRDLDALRDGEAVAHIRYDFATHTRRKTDGVLEPRRFVIVDGILLLSVPELASRFDLRVFVDTPADLRFVRRLRRDTAVRGRSVESVCSQYLATVRPMHEEFVAPVRDEAHIIVSGFGRLEEACQSVCAAVLETLPRRDCSGLPVGS